VVCRIDAPEGDASLIPAGRQYQLKVRAPTRPRAVRDRAGRELAWTYDGFVNVEGIALAGEGAVVRMVWG
jgi:YD repeat-containing protein